MMLWPRFKQVLELNLQSIRSANLKKMGYGAYPPLRPLAADRHNASCCTRPQLPIE